MGTKSVLHAYAVHEPGGRFEPFDYEVGELTANEVEIDVLYCGICHSDLSMRDNDWQFSSYPLVAGHEVIGKVSAVGSGVTNLSTGTLVGLGWHCGYCGHCHACSSGDQNLCQAATGTIIGHHGGFGDKVRADAASVITIPDGLDPKCAGPLLCGGVTVFNPLVQYDVKPTDKVAVIGIGGLGHLALQFCRAWGCEVTAFTASESKREDAMRFGAHHTLNSRNHDAIEAAAGSFDLILSTVNVALDWNLYLSTLKAKGRLHFVGATLEPLDVNVFQLIGGQRSISGSPVGSPQTIGQMLDFAVRHNIAPQVDFFSMTQINEAFDHLKSGNAKYRIVLSN